MMLAEQYFERVDRILEAIAEDQLPGLQRAAELIADRILSGGGLYIADEGDALTIEATGRAAGLMLLSRLGPDGVDVLAEQDTLIVVARVPDDTSDISLVQGAKARGAATVVLCPPGTLAEEADVALDDHVPAGDAVLDVEGVSGRICPISGPANAVLVWALCAEVVETMTARGHAPQVWLSVRMVGARERNERAREICQERGY